MKKELGAIFTLGEYKRLNNNLEILEKICKGLELNLEDLFKGIVELK